MKNNKIAAPLIFLVLGIVLVSIGSTISSSQEGKIGVSIIIFGVLVLFSSLYMFLKLRKSANNVTEK